MAEKQISEYEFSNRFVHWSLVALICLAGIGISIWINRKIFEDNFEKLPYSMAFDEIKTGEEDFIISFSLENKSGRTISRNLFDFDLYIDDIQMAESRLDSDAPANEKTLGRFIVSKEKLEPGEHVLTLLARMDRSLTRPVHYVANRKWEILP